MRCQLLFVAVMSGLRNCLSHIWLQAFGNSAYVKLDHRHHGTLTQEGEDLVTYAIINSIAMRKILKKYDKIYYYKQGQAFRSQARSMHIEIHQSPWQCELLAFYINLRGNEVYKRNIPDLFEECFLKFDGDKPTLSCISFDSLKLEINLTCSICLDHMFQYNLTLQLIASLGDRKTVCHATFKDTVFDPVSLTCGHIFCYMCCCSAASVTIVDGMKAADPQARCPLCRQPGVYEGAVHLDELSILLSQRVLFPHSKLDSSCPEYCEQCLQSERVQHIRQVKENWDSKCRAFTGICT